MVAPRGVPVRHSLVLLIAASGIASCAPSVEQRGNLPSPDKLSEIHAGSTTKDEVTKILGTPSSVSVFNNDKSWYYISRRTAQTAFFDPTVLDQQVYIVKFDDQGVVKTLDHKVLEDGKEITPVARATPAPGRELSFLEQLIGNLGKFNGGSEGGSSGGGGGRPPGPSPNENKEWNKRLTHPSGKNREQQQRDNVSDLDHRVDRRASGVLIGVANRIAGHRGLMGLRSFAPVMTFFDVLLGVIPGSAP